MRIKHKKSAKITPKKSGIFPLWALFIVLGCIAATGLFFSRRLANVKKIEGSNFKLY